MDFTILIADRNRNVRNLLQREMTSAGYRVRLAENAREVIKWTFQNDPLDLIILDPDLPDSDDSRILDVVLDRIPAVPVIVHTHLSDYKGESNGRDNVFFVEKSDISVEHLKRVVFDALINDIPLPLGNNKKDRQSINS